MLRFDSLFEPSSPTYATYSQAIVRPTQALAQYPSPYGPVQRAPSVWDTYRQMLAPTPEPSSPIQSAVTGLRHNGEGMAIAALLALYQRHVGSLDFRGKYPIDGILAAAFFALSVKDAGKPDGYASDLRALSQSCSSVMVFRKLAGDTVKEAPAPQTTSIPRNTTTDPILEAARQAGF